MKILYQIYLIYHCSPSLKHVPSTPMPDSPKFVFENEEERTEKPKQVQVPVIDRDINDVKTVSEMYSQGCSEKGYSSLGTM